MSTRKRNTAISTLATIATGPPGPACAPSSGPRNSKELEGKKMDYNLAQRLKEAGWPQPSGNSLEEPIGLFGLFDKPSGCWLYSPDDHLADPERAYAPSLNELLRELPRVINGDSFRLDAYEDSDKWCAGYVVPEIEDDDPRVALAELWLTPEVQEAIKINVFPGLNFGDRR
jgi:hypothetical protein